VLQVRTANRGVLCGLLESGRGILSNVARETSGRIPLGAKVPRNSANALAEEVGLIDSGQSREHVGLLQLITGYICRATAHHCDNRCLAFADASTFGATDRRCSA
jgi:hypothetical protein